MRICSMRKERDMQKLKVYAAENTIACRQEKPYDTLLEVWVFLERVQKDKWFLRHYGRWTFKVDNGQGARIARGGYNGRTWATNEHISYLKLPRWSRNRLIILHEIAHGVTRQKHGRLVAGHGREYAAIYLDLVRHFLGAEAGAELRAAFKGKRVKHRPKRVLSPEQLEVMRERGRQLAAKRRDD